MNYKKLINEANNNNIGDMYDTFSHILAEKVINSIDARKATIASTILEDCGCSDCQCGEKKKVTCPECDGEGCEHCDGKGYHLNLDEGQRWADEVSIPASKQTKGYIESGRAKILMNVPSSLDKAARFVVAKNPNTGSNQDKVLMFTISDPDRGRIKMFAFHGSHVSHQKAMDFAKRHKLVAKEDAKGNPLYAKESVELDEGKTEFAVAGVGSGMFIKAFPTEKIARQYIKNTYSQKKKLRGKLGVIEVPLGADIVSNQMKRFGKIKVVKESVELGEDNTAAVAKQVKQAVKKYTTGKLAVQSKGGKTRFIMVRADKIDNELRKKVLNVVAPTANVRDKSNISYGNISDRIISASVEQWMKALGLKESVELDEDRFKTLPGKEVAKRMKAVPSMKPYVAQVAKLKKVSAIDLERLLPYDKVSVKDIDRVMYWKESVELDEAGDPRIANLSNKSKEMLASLANAMDTTGGPFLDSKNLKFLTKKGVDDTLKAGSKLNLSGGPKKFFTLIKKELGESVELDEVMSDREMDRFNKAHTALHTRYHKQALQIIKFIDSVEKHKQKWVDSFGDYVTAKLPKQLKLSSPNSVEYQQGRGRGDWSFLFQHGNVRYNNRDMPWMPKSGELPFDKFMKLLDTWKKNANKPKSTGSHMGRFTESVINQLQTSNASKMPVDININGSIIHITPDISENLINLHDELNEENQTKMREMLSSNSGSFAQLARFAQER